jgi:hypothetical protein
MSTKDNNPGKGPAKTTKSQQQEHKIDEVLLGLFYFLIFKVLLILIAILNSYASWSSWARALSVVASFLTISGAHLIQNILFPGSTFVLTTKYQGAK